MPLEVNQESEEEPQEESQEPRRSYFADRVIDYAKKRGKQALFRLAKAGLSRATLAALLSNPIGWVIIVVVIVAIILVIIGIVAFVLPSLKGYFGQKAVPEINLNLYSDKVLLQKFLSYAGDARSRAQILVTQGEEFKKELERVKNQIESLPIDQTKKEEAGKKIDSALDLVSQIILLPTAARQKAAQEKIAQIERLLKEVQTITGVGADWDPIACPQILETKGITILRSNDQEGFRTGKIESKRLTGHIVSLDGRICRLLLEFARNNVLPITVSTVVGGHKQFATGGRQSRHWTGHAIDIGNEEIGAKLMPWIISNSSTLQTKDLMPRQVIGPTRFAQWAVDKGKNRPGFTDAEHQNHIHIGF